MGACRCTEPAIKIPLMLPNHGSEIGPLKGLLGAARAASFCVIGHCRNADVDVDRGVGVGSRGLNRRRYVDGSVVVYGGGW